MLNLLSLRLTRYQTTWLGAVNTTGPNGTAPPWTPTLPLTSSLALPTAIPTTTPTLDNVTTDLSTPYIDFVSDIPNLSTSLTTLGRAFHREMNSPVHQAIGGLQQSLSAIQSSMLSSNLIRPNAVIRTIRASSSLEDARQAWSRFLNLPGRVDGSGGDTSSTIDDDGDETDSSSLKRRDPDPFKPATIEREHYTHRELWGSRRRRLTRPAMDHDVRPGAADTAVAAQVVRAFRRFVV